LTYAEFQEDWQQAADAEYALYVAEDSDVLIRQVKDRRYGECYQLWRAIPVVATLQDAGSVLIEVLRRDSEEYLIRYHAAAALLKLIGTSTFEPADLSAEHPQRAANLDTVEELLRERLQ
jgi:hypothetical protein